jgi:putative spermidine/putrescine transport system permease protein
MVPEVVLGLSFLILFSRLHWYNPILNILILHVILTLPYAVRVISSNLYRFDLSLEEAARVFGASKIKTFFKITLPIIKPGVVSASIFAFVISFGNFTATLFLIQKRGTLPIQMYSYITTENDPTVAAVSATLIFMTILLILALEKFFSLNLFTSKG